MANDAKKDASAEAAQDASFETRNAPAVELVRATDAETARVRKAWDAGERIPEGFYCHFDHEGGQTVLIVEKKA